MVQVVTEDPPREVQVDQGVQQWDLVVHGDQAVKEQQQHPDNQVDQEDLVDQVGLEDLQQLLVNQEDRVVHLDQVDQVDLAVLEDPQLLLGNQGAQEDRVDLGDQVGQVVKEMVMVHLVAIKLLL